MKMTKKREFLPKDGVKPRLTEKQMDGSVR
jgi:hypothetical protein